MQLPFFVKATYAGAVAFLGALGTALAEASSVTGQQWVFISLATLLAFGGVLGWQAAPASVSTSVRR